MKRGNFIMRDTLIILAFSIFALALVTYAAYLGGLQAVIGVLLFESIGIGVGFIHSLNLHQHDSMQRTKMILFMACAVGGMWFVLP